MKTKIFGLALATTLALAACNSDGGSEEDTDDAGTPAEPVEDTQGDNQTDDDSNDDNSGSEESSSDSSGNSSEAIAIDDVNLSPEDAIEIAQGEFDGDLHEVQLDQDRGDWVYKIDLRSADEEAEVTINQETEEVVDVRTDSEGDDDEEEILDYSSVSSIDEAFEVASSDAGGGDISEWTLSMDDGKAEYDIDLLYENEIYEYTIDAESLEILDSERDDED
ncbi:PepSY domain-containing protein [Jeotgalicoccus sp. S0W5]|uniref:PepSY domain-containing protein n=1 Tax=Jeotgalicoccus sp. S0W5 TaxID=2527874 RepID=UPI0014152564|nr:PepSY domain-containing protein [Jeotgalicoccus sp. S0W5]